VNTSLKKTHEKICTACEKIEDALDVGGPKKDVACLVLSGVALAIALLVPNGAASGASWVAVVLCGLPIIIGAIIGLLTEFDIKADVLVSIALVASLATGEWFAAGEIAFIMQIGAFLEESTVRKARAGIERLVDLTPQTARVIERASAATDSHNTKAGEQIIPAVDVQQGDILRVLAGETVPVDGVILEGNTSIDESVMTGEPIPADKTAGDDVISGTINRFGVFTMRANCAGSNSSIQRMAQLVSSADASRAHVVRTADKWATWIVVAALTTAIITWAVSGELLRAVTVLVVFCPCALVLATPTAITAAIGNASKHGALVREGSALERLAQVAQVCFDKTGTLTLGKPQVVEVHPADAQTQVTHSADSNTKDVTCNATDTQLTFFDKVALAESQSEHPLGRAVVASWEAQSGTHASNLMQQSHAHVSNFEMLVGRGVSACVSGQQVLVAKLEELRSRKIAVPSTVIDAANQAEALGRTVIFAAINGVFAGYLVLADCVRPEACQATKALKSAGVEPVLITGDSKAAAQAIAASTGITQVYAQCLPADKLALIDNFEKQGTLSCMVGDGVNDAPALKRAYVSVAMGGIGSDIAVEAADIALVNDDIAQVARLVDLGKHTMRTIKLNLTFAMTINIIATVLAVLGLINPVIGALVHNCGSVLVIINSARLLAYK
jgi:heavy metal translocating P-type ATPase